MHISGIHHVAIICSDYQASIVDRHRVTKKTPKNAVRWQLQLALFRPDTIASGKNIHRPLQRNWVFVGSRYHEDVTVYRNSSAKAVPRCPIGCVQFSFKRPDFIFDIDIHGSAHYATDCTVACTKNCGIHLKRHCFKSILPRHPQPPNW